MDREIETVIDRLMSDLKAAQDLSEYLAANNKRLREALRRCVDWENNSESFEDVMRNARAALKEGE